MLRKVNDDLEQVLRCAIQLAKGRGSGLVTVDDLLLACLGVSSRFGISQIGEWPIDLDSFGWPWRERRDPGRSNTSYSDGVVLLLEQAARIASAEVPGGPPTPLHVLACFAEHREGLMQALAERYGIDSFRWRAALARMGSESAPRSETAPSGPPQFLTPDQAAVWLGVHIQTLRGYIRSGKLPAFRIAGERALRIRSSDLAALLEPFQPAESDE